MEIKTSETLIPDKSIMRAATQAVGPEQLQTWNNILSKYKAGKSATDRRIKASEQWWKLRNAQMAEGQTVKAQGDDEFKSESAWLHNVITSKHADLNAAYPEPTLLPREENDQQEAKNLSAIVPFVLARNGFRKTWSDIMWQKLKAGTGAYKVVWDASKMNGLGDIAIEKVNLLNIYWEPGLDDIQKSRFFFHLEDWDKDQLLEKYPSLNAQELSSTVQSTQYKNDDSVSSADKITVIDVYYHKHGILHYCKYVGGQVIYATENETAVSIGADGVPTGKPAPAVAGLYDHGLYPYVLDPLFPIEGSPFGYGYVDIERNPQMIIDSLGTSFVRSAKACAEPRYMTSDEGTVNDNELGDYSKRIVHVPGRIDEAGLRMIEATPLNAVYMNVRDSVINELRETSGNTDAGTGSAPAGVTAASAIAALQEAAGKGAKDAISMSYEAFTDVTGLVVELIRQFYDLPRQFRITGEFGEDEFMWYDNHGIKPVSMGMAFGEDQGEKMPIFDIKIGAQKANVYTRVSQNELAIQFFNMGFFVPEMAEQALMCLQMMDFDGKEKVMQMIQKNATMQQMLMKYLQLALQIADPAIQMMAQQDMIMLTGQDPFAPAPVEPSGNSGQLSADSNGTMTQPEPAIVDNARRKAANAAQPTGGPV